ncbi:LpqB family beta-propeller domain-containing protein [Micromonospora sp. NPDC049799]|uniref:LpqB family beta-propeller domain-containing protein n=1 Tax=Micromonospora sp. NPDC049799 TaxID=3154741 RepID=UPI0033D58E91
MTRRFLAGLIGGVCLLGSATGCGIPDRTEVRVEGPGPAVEGGATSSGRIEPPSRTAADSPEDFVRNFLAAPAGEPDRAYDRVRQFIEPRDRSGLQEKRGSEVGLTVVRLTKSPEITPNLDDIDVTITVQQVGRLRADGVLAPPEATETSYRFRLRPTLESGDQTDWYLADPPNVLLLSVDALADHYLPRPVYFWSSDRSRLVPDQRYLPRAVPEDRRVSEVVKWLTDGPSEWLGRVVSPLPDRTQLINNATRTDDRWEVDLDMPGEDRTRVDQLGTQLAWSLSWLDGQLELKIRNQQGVTIDLEQRRQARPLYSVEGTPQRFCVYEGSIHALSYPGEPSGPVPVAEAANTGVVSAALNRAGTGVHAALVVAGANGRKHLSVGSGFPPVSAFARSSGAGWSTVSRPVWLRSAAPDPPVGLVVADGGLYRFDGRAQVNAVPLGVAGTVTAVAAALDGHRLAVVVDGVLHVVAVNVDGGVLATGPARRLPTQLTRLSAVDWYDENRLIVAGSAAGRWALYELSVDGALEVTLEQDIGSPATHLAAYPANPRGGQFGLAMYVANQVAFRTGRPPERIQREQVAEVTAPPSGVRPGNPTAPFFLY